MDAQCRLSTRSDFRSERASLAISQPSRAYRSGASSQPSSLRSRFNQLAIEDDPDRAPLPAADIGTTLPLADAEDAADTSEAFFARLATQTRVIWSRDQIMKLRKNNLCFHCARPNCIARTCENPRADPSKTVLNHINAGGPCHLLPDDVDLYDNLVDYDFRLNEVAPQEH